LTSQIPRKIKQLNKDKVVLQVHLQYLKVDSLCMIWSKLHQGNHHRRQLHFISEFHWWKNMMWTLLRMELY